MKTFGSGAFSILDSKETHVAVAPRAQYCCYNSFVINFAKDDCVSMRATEKCKDADDAPLHFLPNPDSVDA